MSKQLRQAIDAAGVGLWDWDLQSNRVRYSSQWKRQIGYADDEIGDSFEEWRSRVHPDDLPRLLAQVDAYLKQPWSKYDAEFRFRHKDGSYRWIYTQGELLYDDTGKPVRMLGSHIDITKLKQTEEQLQRYAALVEASTEFIGIADLAGRLLYVNPAGCRLLGLDPQQVTHTRIADFVTPDHRAQLEAEILPAMFQRGFWQGEFCLRHFTTGRPVPVAQHAFVINDPTSGAPMALANISHDITARKLTELALRDSEQRLARLIASLPGVVYRCKNDADWTAEFMSDGILALTGYGPADLVAGRIHYAQLVHADDYALVTAAIQQALPERRPFEVVYRIIARDGSMKWVWERGQGVYADNGEVVALEGFITDITASKQAELAVRASEKRLRTIIDAEPECVKLVGPGGVLLQMNAAGLAMVEADDPSQVIGKSLFPLIRPPHRQAFQALTERALAGEKGSLQFEIVGFKGTRRWLETYAVPIDDTPDGKRLALSITRDITERRQAEARLSYLAHHDTLTDLPNRTLFNDRLSQAMIEAQRRGRFVAVLLLDLDRFKTINDTLGHEAGDQLLKDVSRRLQLAVRDGDTVARLSGDEFAIVLGDMAAADDGGRVAQKILQVFAAPFRIASREFYITSSIGVTVHPSDGDTIDGLLRNADAAMYRAKDAGRNTYQFYTAEMTRHAFERLGMENALRRALERDELLLEYQPIFDGAGGRVVSVEALVRWRHPEFGMLSPARFIPLAEETGLILPLGDWVLHAACAQLARWRAAGAHDLRVAVNLSVRQFQRQQLLQTIAQVVDAAGLSADALELEITESILAEGKDVTDSLYQMSAMGVQFSIDDFGIGYSSLSYLKRFPIDRLKIDQSFVRDIPGDAEDTAIATAIIAMAHNLGIKVVAEGVESAAQLEFLQAQGCDYLQGYYLSRPLTADAFGALLQRHRSPA